ncbi:MAG: hypothetical protein HQL73_02690 [Magnetococcales bacterium]|nr:hypothetical protein [Magnetococcales bacterium]
MKTYSIKHILDDICYQSKGVSASDALASYLCIHEPDGDASEWTATWRPSTLPSIAEALAEGWWWGWGYSERPLDVTDDDPMRFSVTEEDRDIHSMIYAVECGDWSPYIRRALALHIEKDGWDVSDFAEIFGFTELLQPYCPLVEIQIPHPFLEPKTARVYLRWLGGGPYRHLEGRLSDGIVTGDDFYRAVGVEPPEGMHLRVFVGCSF